MKENIIDNSPLTPFHKKLTLIATGGVFIDGYILSIIGPALPLFAEQYQVDALWLGLIGASTLLGILLGGALFGYITDIVGRNAMFTLDLLAFLAASIGQFFADSAWELCVWRLIMGIAVGADYPIATALLSEFLPKKHRAPLLGMTMIMWFVGAIVAYIVGYTLATFVGGPTVWKWMLVSSAVPTIILLLLRLGTPESPRWLLSKGRVDEADKVIKQVYGPEASIEDIYEDDEQDDKVGLRTLLQPEYLKRIVFIGVTWTCAVIPLFALYTFGPRILEQFNMAEGNSALLGESLINLCFLIGCIILSYMLNSLGRRPVMTWSFLLMAIPLLIMGLFPDAPIWVIMVGFAAYAILSGGPNILVFVYPNELFPTKLRGTAVGIVTAFSRLGSFVGVFLLPLGIERYGIGPIMLIGFAITFVGFLVSYALAPETKGMTLAEASKINTKAM